MYCKNCGIEIEDNSQYCWKCGSGVSKFAKPDDDNPKEENTNHNNLNNENYQSEKPFWETDGTPKSNASNNPRKRKPLATMAIAGLFIFAMLGLYLRYGAYHTVQIFLDNIKYSFSFSNLLFSPLGFFDFLKNILIVVFSSFGIIIFIVYVAIVLIYWGSGVMVDSKRAFGISTFTPLVVLIASSLITTLFSFIPLIGTILGLIAVFFLIPLILKGLYGVTYGSGFGIYFLTSFLSALGFASIFVIFII